MDYNDKYFLDSNTIVLLIDKDILIEFQKTYVEIIDIFKSGIEKQRKLIKERLDKKGFQNDYGSRYVEDEFALLDQLDNIDNQIFQYLTIMSMYSKCEIMLKNWLKAINPNLNNINHSNINGIKKLYKCRGIDLDRIDNFIYFKSLNKTNNCIKHNDGVVDIKHIDFYQIGKNFRRGEKIKLDFKNIIQLADKISSFMLDILIKVSPFKI